MTELEKCMESLITIFHRYADADGDGKSLSKKELNKLVETELPTFLKVRISPIESNLSPLVPMNALFVNTLSLPHDPVPLSEPEEPQGCGADQEGFGPKRG